MIKINPPLTFVTLQPAWSNSSDIKLPPYLKQFSKGFDVAIKQQIYTPLILILLILGYGNLLI